MKDSPNLRIGELLVDLIGSEAHELMAQIVDPCLVGRTVEDVLAAPVNPLMAPQIPPTMRITNSM